MDADAESPREATADTRKGAPVDNRGGDAKRSVAARILTSGRSRGMVHHTSIGIP